MSGTAESWLRVDAGDAPLIVGMPHAGTFLPPEVERGLVDPWLGRKDVDWWVDRLYAFAPDLGATVVATALARTVIDVNRDPSGASLYPGAATTGLCPTATFDGETLWRAGASPSPEAIAQRTDRYFAPYHAALEGEIGRLAVLHGAVVLFDAHSIRSRVPRLFDGALPHFNIGSNNGASCAPELTAAVEAACAATPFSRVTNGRFRGGWTTRHYGRPEGGVHAIQMELACRAYMDEPATFTAESWPTPFDEARAAPMAAALRSVLEACLDFARRQSRERR